MATLREALARLEAGQKIEPSRVPQNGARPSAVRPTVSLRDAVAKIEAGDSASAVTKPALTPRETMLDRSRREFPVLLKHDIAYREVPDDKSGRMLEFYPPGERDSFDPKRPAIQVIGARATPSDVAADIVSHHLARGADARLTSYYDRFRSSLTQNQEATLREQYTYARTNEGEQRPYEQWRDTTGIPAYFRGYAFKQWENANEMYTPEQLAMFDEMLGYLRGQDVSGTDASNTVAAAARARQTSRGESTEEIKRRAAAGEPIVDAGEQPSVLREFGSELVKSADTFATKALESIRTSVVPSVVAGMANQSAPPAITEKERLDFIKRARAMSPEQRTESGIVPQDLIDPRPEILWREKGYDISQYNREYKEGVQELRDTARETTERDARFDPNSRIAATTGEFAGTVLGDIPLLVAQPELGAELTTRLGARVAERAGPTAGRVVAYLAKNGLNAPVDVVVGQIDRALKGGDLTLDTIGTDAAVALVARNVLGVFGKRDETIERFVRARNAADAHLPQAGAEVAESGVGVVHDGAAVSPSTPTPSELEAQLLREAGEGQAAAKNRPAGVRAPEVTEPDFVANELAAKRAASEVGAVESEQLRYARERGIEPPPRRVIPDDPVSQARATATEVAYDKHVPLLARADVPVGERYLVDKMFDKTSSPALQQKGREIYDSFEEVRTILRQQHPEGTVRLYRYEAPAETHIPNKTVTHWMDDVGELERKIGRSEESGQRELVTRDVPIEDIVAAPLPRRGGMSEWIVLNRDSQVAALPDEVVPPSSGTPKGGGRDGGGNAVERADDDRTVTSPPPPLTSVAEAEAYFRDEITRREAERKAGVPTGMARARQELAEVKAAVVDYLAPVEDAIYAALRAEGRTVKPSEDIRNAFDSVIMADHVAGQWARDNGIEEILRSVPDVDQFGQYLLARHAPAIEAAGFESGRDLAKDASAVALLRDVYEPAAKQFDVAVRKLLDYRVEAGLVTRQYADYVNTTYPEYVPFTRVFNEMEEAPRGGTGGGVASVSKSAVDKKLTGSKRAVEDPVESFLIKIHDSFRQGEMNKATRTLIGYHTLEGNPLELEPRRLADNVRERVKITEDLSTLGREQRKLRRDTVSTKGKFVAADKVFNRQLGRINEAIQRTADESQTIYDAMRVHAADFDPESAIDGLLSKSVSNEHRITQMQDRLHAVAAELDELTGEGSRIYEAARTAAGDGATPAEINRILDRGLRNARHEHGVAAKGKKLEDLYDQTRAADFRIAQREADEAHTVAMERLETKGLAAERRLYELQGRLEQVDYSKAAEKRNELEQTLNALKLAVSERSATVKELRGELLRLRDEPKRPGESTIPYLNEGVRETWAIKPEIAAAVKGLDNERLGLLGRIIAVPGRVLRVGTTGVNLAFTAVNTIRDQGTIAVLSSRSAATSLANPANFTKALFAALKHDALYEEAVREGALFTSYDIARKSPKLAVDDIIGPRKAFERARRGGATATAKYIVSTPAKALRAAEDLVSRSEQVGRIQVYNGMRDQLIREGMSPAEARIAARQAALWTTSPFHRSGQWGRVFSSIPYLNANIQGLRQMIGTAAERPAETALKASALFAGIIGAMVWNMAEPDRRAAYDDIDDREKTDYLIIVPPNPTKDERGAWNVMKIPVPQGVNDVLAPLRRTGEWTARKALSGDPRAMDVAGTLLGPEDGGNKMLSMFVPQPVRPSLEVALNKNIYTGRDIVSPGLLRKTDTAEQVYPWTSGTARIIGKSIDASPIKVEHFIRATAGGAAMQALNASDQALAATGAIPPEQIGGETPWGALVRRFTKARGGELERERKRRKKK